MRLYILLWGFLVFLLGGCSHTPAVPVSSVGTVGAPLEQPLPKNARFLVLSALQPVSVNKISENIFSYKKLERFQIPASHLNPLFSQTITHVLQNNGYAVAAVVTLNSDNPLNTANIQPASAQLSGSSNRGVTRLPARGSLTPEAKQFLLQQIKLNPASFIALLTQTGAEPLTLDIKCEISQMNTYSHAYIEPGISLYKIYLIDARSMRPLAWITGGFSRDLSDTHVCKSPEKESDMMIQGLNKAVSGDLSQILHRPAT